MWLKVYGRRQTIWEPHKAYLIFIGLWAGKSCPIPQWGRQPWNDFSVVWFCHYSICPHTPGPIGKCSLGLYLCKVDPHSCWEKRKGVKRRGSSLCISPALKGLGSLSWAKRWGHLHSTALTLREEPLFSLCLWGMPSSLWSSYPSTPRTGC